MAVIKVGNNTIGKISVIEPYDDPVGTPNFRKSRDDDDWTRPSGWLAMPLESGTPTEEDQKANLLLFVPSGTQVPVSLLVLGSGDSGLTSDGGYTGYLRRTHTLLDWGDGNTHLFHHADRRYVDWAHHLYDFDNLDANTEIYYNGSVVRQVLIEIDGSASAGYSGISSIDMHALDGNKYYSELHGYSSTHVKSHNLLDYVGNHEACHGLSWRSKYVSRADHLQRIKLIRQNRQHCYQWIYDMPSLEVFICPSGMTQKGNTTQQMFAGCRNLKQVSPMALDNVTTMEGMFQHCENLKSEDIILYNTNNVTNFSSVFSQCKGLTDFPNIDTSNGQNFTNMFVNCAYLKGANFPSGYSFGNATNFYQMFKDCYNLTTVPNVFSGGQVTNMQSMFQGCVSLKNIPKEINLSSSVSTYNMFHSCFALDEVNIGDATNLVNMRGMFYDCRKLKKITFKSPETVKPTGCQNIFTNCMSLKSAPPLNYINNTTFNSAFQNCHSLQEVPEINPSSCTNVRYMFYDCHQLREIGGFQKFYNKLETCQGMFRDCYSLDKFPSGLFVDFNSCGTINDETFYDCTKLKEIPYINMSGGTSLNNSYSQVFYRNQTLHSIGDIKFGISTRNMFADCYRLATTPAWDMSGVQDATQMFNNARGLRAFNASGVSCDIGFYQCNLGSGSIKEIFDNLETVSSSKTIDIRRNYGTNFLHPDTTAIATNKGWTVTT